jgi:hypothetical protein
MTGWWFSHRGVEISIPVGMSYCVFKWGMLKESNDLDLDDLEGILPFISMYGNLHTGCKWDIG